MIRGASLVRDAEPDEKYTVIALGNSVKHHEAYLNEWRSSDETRGRSAARRAMSPK